MLPPPAWPAAEDWDSGLVTTVLASQPWWPASALPDKQSGVTLLELECTWILSVALCGGPLTGCRRL